MVISKSGSSRVVKVYQKAHIKYLYNLSFNSKHFKLMDFKLLNFQAAFQN